MLARLQDIEALLAEQRRQLERLLDAYLTNLFPEQLVEERRAKLDRRISELESDRASFECSTHCSDVDTRPVRDLVAFARKWVTTYFNPTRTTICGA